MRESQTNPLSCHNAIHPNDGRRLAGAQRERKVERQMAYLIIGL